MGSGLKPDGLKAKSSRIQRGWTQEQFARVADVSPRTIQRSEAGGNAFFETLRFLASAFELEVQDLLGETLKTREGRSSVASVPQADITRGACLSANLA